MFVTPEQILFVAAPEPMLVVTGVAEAAALPELAVADGRAARCDGWSLLPRMTMCVVDGPGDAGFLVGAFEAERAWFDAVDAVGGATVVAVDADPAGDLPTLAARPDARGGFVPLLGAG
jgi:hypothetical protein